jgi:hypothetical protein
MAPIIKSHSDQARPYSSDMYNFTPPSPRPVCAELVDGLPRNPNHTAYFDLGQLVSLDHAVNGTQVYPEHLCDFRGLIHFRL